MNLEIEKKPKPINIRSVYTLSSVFLLVTFFVRFSYFEYYVSLSSEDGLMEYLQALLYFLAAVFAIKLALHLYKAKRLVFVIIAQFFIAGITLFVAFEEVSWGQRIFDFEVPPMLQEINRQNEFNVHNLEAVQNVLHTAYVLVGLYGMFSGYLYARFVQGKPWSRTFEYSRLDLLIIIPQKFAWLFVPLFAFYFPYEYLSGVEWLSWLHTNDQELPELFLSLGWFLSIRDKYILEKYP